MSDGDHRSSPNDGKSGYETSSRREFFDYYAKQSEKPETLRRFENIRATVLRAMRKLHGALLASVDVADIGCGAGTQCMMWSQLGHRVHGLDVNEPLVRLAEQRAAGAGLVIDYRVGSATALPWQDASMDVCLLPELLEHVPPWEHCLDEALRVLKPGGILFLSTNNKLCPVQSEFNLPLYSWYPGWLKRRYEHLAVTTRPELANYATYPAVNWFTYSGLARHLAVRGFETLDRFDLVETEGLSALKRFAIGSLRAVGPLRTIGHVLTPYTVVVAQKRRLS